MGQPSKWGSLNLVQKGGREREGDETIRRIGFYRGRGHHRTGHRAGSSDGGIHEIGHRLTRVWSARALAIENV
jgi:hypothetical protein